MNNLIQLIIAAVLSSPGFAEEVEIASLTNDDVKMETNSTTTIITFLPAQEQEWFQYPDIFHFNPIMTC